LIACGGEPTVRRKRLGDISYTKRVIGDFVLNFVAMATGVGRGRICLASFNSPTPKTLCCMKRSPGYLLYKSSYSRFCPKFRYHGNTGNPVVNLNDAIKEAVPENPTLDSKITTLSVAYNRSYDSLNFF